MIIIQCDPHETNLILTESPNAPSALQTNCDQIVFEEYEFATYSRSIGRLTYQLIENISHNLQELP